MADALDLCQAAQAAERADGKDCGCFLSEAQGQKTYMRDPCCDLEHSDYRCRDIGGEHAALEKRRYDGEYHDKNTDGKNRLQTVKNNLVKGFDRRSPRVFLMHV